MYDYETIKKNFIKISEKDKLTYREMCELVGDRFATSSKTRKNQVARWEIIISFKKRKDKFYKIKILDENSTVFDFSFFHCVQTKLSNIKKQTYESLCLLLNEPVFDNKKDKEKQLLKWRTYFTFEKDGNNFKDFKIYNFSQVVSNLTKTGQLTIRERNIKTLENEINKWKDFSLTPLIVPRTIRRGVQGRNSYNRWKQRGVYLIFNDSEEAVQKYGNKVCYVGSTIDSFYRRFCGHLNGTTPNTKELLSLKSTQIDFLYIAKEEDTEEFIREKEAEFWAEYKNKGYNLLNKKAPYYHKSSKKKKEKQNPDYFDGACFNDEDWLIYRKSKVKIKGEKFPRLIKFLREELDLEYSEDFGIWTEKEMIPKIQEYMSSKNEVKLNEVED